jgi:hypothetical protein
MAALRRLLLAIAIAAGGCAPPAFASQLYQSQMMGCNQQASFSGISSVADLIPAVTGQQIYLCGFLFNAGAAPATFQLEYGTGTNCGTGTHAIGPLFTLGVNGVLPDHKSFYDGLFAPAGNDLCVVPSASGSGIVYYQQF